MPPPMVWQRRGAGQGRQHSREGTDESALTPAAGASRHLVVGRIIRLVHMGSQYTGAYDWSFANTSLQAASSAYVPVLRCSTDYAECRASQWLYTIVCPIMLGAGTVGNLLSFITMMSRDLRRTAFGIYIASLSVTDTVAIWSALVRHFIKGVWLFDVRETGVWSCRIHRYIVYASIDSSSWILVALTTGRLVSVCRPEKVRSHKSAARARILVPVIVAVQLAWNAPTLWTLGVQPNGPGGAAVNRSCSYTDAASRYYWQEVQPYLSMAAASIVPFALMLATNVSLVVLLRRRTHGEQSVYRRSRAGQGLARSGHAKTAMLLVVSFFFLATTVPTFINTALEALLDADAMSAAKARMELVDAITTLLLYANGSLNFFLYCLSGTTFRRHCCLALANAKNGLLRRSTRDASASTYIASASVLPKVVVEMRRASVWTSSGGSSPGETPGGSPVSWRSSSAVACLGHGD